MNKQAIITILFALVAIAGYGQSFTPIVEDSIDFVITGTTTSTNDSVCAFPCAPYEPGMKFPICGKVHCYRSYATQFVRSNR